MRGILLSLGVINIFLRVALGERYASKLSTGFYPVEIDSPIFYDTFIPLIHEYNYPTWNLLDITLRDWRAACHNDEFSPSYTCPVFFHLEKFIERLQMEIVNQNTRQFAQQVPANMNNITDKCSKIQRHFNSLLTSKSSIESYLHSWLACPVQGAVIKPKIMDYTYNIKEIYKKTLTRFESEFSNRASSIGSSDRTGPSFYVNHITASQGLMMFNYWVEHNRWENAARSCALQQIPTTLIKPGNLTSSLKIIEDEASKQKYELSIPANETGTYLVKPMTDCTFSEDSNFLVRVLVPIKKRTSQVKLIKLQPIPFLLNDDADTYSICQIFDAEGTFIHDPITGYLVRSNCQVGELCQLENPARIPIPNLCASAYFAGSSLEIKKYCNFQCEKVIDGFYPKLPIFRQVRSDTFTVTGNSNLELVIKCEGKRDELVNPDELGSLEIILPCNCSLHFRSQIYVPEYPCSKELSIKLLMPIQFFNNEFLAREGNQNFSRILEKTMMEPKYFSKMEVNTGEKGRAERIVEIQRDVDSGEAEVMAGAAGAEKSSSRNVGIWVMLVIQGLALVGIVGWFVKRETISKWGGRPWIDPGRMTFANPLASDNEDMSSSGRGRKRGEEGEFDI